MLKGVPGTPQGSFLFNQDVTKVFNEIGLQPLADDPCIFVTDNKFPMIIVLLWVDDSLMVYPKELEEQASQIVSQLKQRFKIHDLGPVKDLLGLNINRDRARKTLTIDQYRLCACHSGQSGHERL